MAISPRKALKTHETTRKKPSRPRTKQEAGDNPAALATYRNKRNFAKTPEPAPRSRKSAAKPRSRALEFVVQKHDASRLHYDVRIEVRGSMMSWAVPKGPSFDPAVKRLAVETEDHPMAYNRFEGRIPDGEYGAGDVLIWDRGTYETVPPGQEEAMRAKGHMVVRFFGKKLSGDWHFVRMKGNDGEAPRAGAKPAWLMVKVKDTYADPTLDIVTAKPRSVVSGKSKTRGPVRKSASITLRRVASRAPRSAASADEGSLAGVKLTNPSKVLFPKDGITKRDIADYYLAIADVMVPHVRGRPLGLQRWPDGIDKKAWFQQNAPENVPEFVRIVDSGPDHGSHRKIVADNRETLVWLANLAAITLHQWASHVPAAATTETATGRALGLPDYAVIDLDPGDGPWEHVITVAETVRGLLEKLTLESAVKTSGQRGLHILVPFAPGPTHEEATEFARKLATAVADALPEIATVERMKAKRHGRLYVDFLQNGEGKTIVAPYTIRAKDGAPVSTPLEWSEVTNKLDPMAWTLRTVLARVEKRGDLLAPLLRSRQVLPSVR